MHRDLDYETKIIKSFNINTMFHICHSSVHTVYCVLKSVWRYVHLVCIGIDLRMCCSASQVIKATSLVCDLPQFCTRSRILLYDHLTCLQNFFFKCNFCYFPKPNLSCKVYGFSWHWTFKRTHYESGGHLPSGISQDAMHFSSIIRLSVQLLQGLIQNALFFTYQYNFYCSKKN